MRRTFALAVLAAGALPLCGSAPWDIDVEGRAGGGRMPHLVPGGCGPSTAPVWYGGVGGRVEASPDRSPQTRLLVAGEADVRAGSLERPGTPPRGVVLFRGTPSIGFDSEYFQLMAGGYVGNDNEHEDLFALPSLSMRIGTRDLFWITLDFLDEPGCYPTQCLLGASYGVMVSDEALLNQGISLGIDGFRTWVRVPFGEGDLWWIVGAEAGIGGAGGGGSQATFALTFGVRTPWLD